MSLTMKYIEFFAHTYSMFNISCHVHIITSKQVYCKIGHIDAIERNVEV
jgi:hypothetical protein